LKQSFFSLIPSVNLKNVLIFRISSINKLTKIKFKTKNYFITGTNWHNSKTMYQIIFHVVSNGNKKGYIVFELCQLQ